jgi:spore maturation protein A
MLVSIVAGVVNGRMEEVNNALLGGGGAAITLSLSLGGAMCLWGGLLRVAEKAGVTERLSKWMSPLMRLLFPGLPPDGAACRAILMNIAANLLGLGNAATPFGIKAMEELQACNPRPDYASRHMITFVVLNTASIQLLPTTVATLRLEAGSSSPMVILPAVWLTSIGAAAMAVLTAKLLGKERTPRATTDHLGGAVVRHRHTGSGSRQTGCHI